MEITASSLTSGTALNGGTLPTKFRIFFTTDLTTAKGANNWTTAASMSTYASQTTVASQLVEYVPSSATAFDGIDFSSNSNSTIDLDDGSNNHKITAGGTYFFVVYALGAEGTPKFSKALILKGTSGEAGYTIAGIADPTNFSVPEAGGTGANTANS